MNNLRSTITSLVIAMPCIFSCITVYAANSLVKNAINKSETNIINWSESLFNISIKLNYE